MTYALWLAEFALECLGAWVCFKGLASVAKPVRLGRRYTEATTQAGDAGSSPAPATSVAGWANGKSPAVLLGSLLAFLAASDVILFIVFQTFGSYALAWACWYQKTGKYALLLLLACQVCGKLLGEEWKASLGTVATLGGLLVAWTYQGQETLAEQLLDAEISASMFLCALICLAWLSRSERLKGFEKWKAAGLLICLGSDVVFTALWTHWDWARNLYPIGAILSLSVWAWGLSRKYPATELRLESIGSPRGESLIEDETLESMVM